MSPPKDAPMPMPPEKFAWAKLNAYGLVFAMLLILTTTDIIHPAGTDLAQEASIIPPGQLVWSVMFVAAGLLVFVGILRADRISESLGMVLATLGLVAQTFVAFALLGVGEFTLTRVALVAIVGGCTAARVSALWPHTGITVTIPARPPTVVGRRK